MRAYVLYIDELDLCVQMCYILIDVTKNMYAYIRTYMYMHMHMCLCTYVSSVLNASKTSVMPVCEGYMYVYMYARMYTYAHIFAQAH